VSGIRRREFIIWLGGAAAAWPLAARAQQAAMPVIGFLSDQNPLGPNSPLIAAFRAGLAEAGYVEGRNVKVEYRWASTREEQLPALAADLVGLRVAVIVAFGSAVPAFAAKEATSTIPIVIVGGTDPVTYGLVGSLHHPGGNVTGITLIMIELAGKRLELLRDMVPQAATIAFLSGGSRRLMFREEVSTILAAASALGLKVMVLEASRDGEIEAAFATVVRHGADALIVGASPYLFYNRNKILAQASLHKVPTICPDRSWAFGGGLMSYSANYADMFCQTASQYVGRILKGTKPADLPVQRPSKFELVINLKTAKALGLDVPATLLARADEVIE
jgi:putative tryptophan/tyrosine transport system substrate-binding protein